MRSDPARISSVLRRSREAAGLTQATLAEMIGTSQSAISAYENGSKHPSDATVSTILSLLRPPPSLTLERRREEVRSVVLSHHATNPRIFGSVARRADTWRSDIDILVELTPGWTLKDLDDMQRDLESIFGPGRVDIYSDGSLPSNSPVLAEAIQL